LHNRGSNFLFADGHVKHLRLEDTFSVSQTNVAAATPPPPPSGGAAPPTDAPTGGAGGTAGLAGGGKDMNGSVEVNPFLWNLTK
jgi:prepilin-type processing-associated H-X9-DG protein